MLVAIGLDVGVALVAVVLAELVLWRLARGAAGALRHHYWPRWHAWAREHPFMAAFAERFPRTAALLARRLTTNHFTGLPLTLMVLAAGYASFALSGIVDTVRTSHGVVAFDDRVMEWFVPYRTTERVEIGMLVTGFANTSALIMAIIIGNGFLWAHRRRGIVGPMWIAFIGMEVTTMVGKEWLDRARPVFTTIATASSPSFPSGHTTGATVVFGFLAYAIARELRSHRRRFAIGYAATVLIALVGVSRVFLGVHFASDVIGGWLIGTFWLLAGFALAEHHRATPPSAPQADV